MNTEAIAGQSMFGMHKGTQGIHMRLRLTACDKKKTVPATDQIMPYVQTHRTIL